MTVCYVNEQLSANKLASNDFDEGPGGQEKWEKFYTSAVPHPCFYLLFTDNELLYRTRAGDVVKLNADLKETMIIVPNQMFVSKAIYLYSSRCTLCCH